MTTETKPAAAAIARAATPRIPFACTLTLLDVIAWLYVLTHITAVNQILGRLIK